jgi:hypothetical protein
VSPSPLADPAIPARTRRRGALAALWTRVGPTHALEGILIFAVLLLVEWVTPGRATLAQMAPHPFWIPVILMSVQKGSASGLAAAALATALGWVAGWPAQTPQEDFYTYSLRVWREPILWIIAALVMGAQRNRQIRDRQALEDRLRLTEEQRNTLGSYCDELHAELAAFERGRATARDCPVEAALEVLHGLRLAGEPDWAPRLADAMACWLGPAEWSLHRLRGGVLHHEAGRRGPLPDRALARLLAAARMQGRPLSVFDRHDAALLDGIGVLACEVRAPGRGLSLGLLVVGQVEPARLTPALPLALAAVAEALGARLAQDFVEAGTGAPPSLRAIHPQERLSCAT